MPELALFGGSKTKQKSFPLWPLYDDNERRALEEVLESRVWWRTPGTKTLEFEKAFAEYHGARHGIAVTNGTAALEVTVAALDIGPGDEVIVPDFTFIATASAVLFANALPVLVDVDPETYCLDPGLTEAAITPRTKAIIAVHMSRAFTPSSTPAREPHPSRLLPMFTTESGIYRWTRTCRSRWITSECGKNIARATEHRISTMRARLR